MLFYTPSVTCPTSSISQDLDNFETLRSCLSYKLYLEMNYILQELGHECKDIYRMNSISSILQSAIRSNIEFYFFINKILAYSFDNN